MRSEATMMPHSLQAIPFFGDTLLAQPGDTPETTLVAIRPICEAIPIAWERQFNKLKAHNVLKRAVTLVVMDMPGSRGAREMVALPLPMVPFWLATIQTGRLER